jgi:hypothetical protein
MVYYVVSRFVDTLTILTRLECLTDILYIQHVRIKDMTSPLWISEQSLP